MLKALNTLIAAVMLISSACKGDLPNDCAVIATEANARVEHNAAWSRVVFLHFVDLQAHELHGHAVTVWQIHEKSHVLLYDASGTIELQTSSRNLSDIVAALNKELRQGGVVVLEAHFID